MNDTEYVLRIVLKARDEIAKVLAKARTEISAFEKDIGKLDKRLEGLNSRITSLNTRVGNVTDKVKEWRAAMRGFGEDGDDAADSIDKVVGGTDRMVASTTKAAKTSKDLRNEFSHLSSELKRLNKDFHDGKRDRDDAIFGFQNIGRALDRLARSAGVGSKIGYEINRVAIEAKDAAKNIIDAQKEAEAESARIDKERADRMAKAAAENTARLEREAQEAEAAAEAAANAELKAANERLAIRKREEAERSRLYERALEEDRRRTARRIALERDSEAAVRSFREFNDRLEAGGISAEEATPRLRRYATEFDRLSRAYRIGSEESQRFEGMAIRVRNVLRDNQETVRRNSVEVDRNQSVWRRLGRELSQTGDNVASLDNRLRGIGLLLVFTFAQQLITALVGLVGNLVAVAFSAVQAGAALGGAFVAGVGQAIPAIGLLAAALHRASMAMEAFELNQKLQQARFLDGERSAAKSADTTDRVANAQESLRDAMERLSEAQERLNAVRAKARDELEDLVFAERRAALAARGAVIGQREAQERLRQSVIEGSSLELDRSTLGVADARLGRQEADSRLRRASRDRAEVGGDAKNLESIKNAAKAVRDAEQAVTRAQRGLEQASRKADEAGGRVITAAGNLNFYLQEELSDSERRLYEALVRIQERYAELYRPITDIIVDSFTRAVDKATELLESPKIINAATDLAEAISDSLDKIVDSLTDSEVVDQLIRITDAGKQNLAPLTDIVISFGRALTNIAEFAGPALSNMLDFIGGIADRFEDLTSDKDAVEDFFLTGERHFEAWINLGLAVIRLFAALSGAGGGAESGLRTIEDATAAVDDLTAKVLDNKDAVADFFEDARQVTREVVRVVAALAKEIMSAFDPSGTRDFADFLIGVVIPAIGEVVRGIGRLVDFFTEINNNDFAKEVGKWVLVMLILAQVANSVIGAFNYIIVALGHMGRGFAALVRVIPGFEKLMGLLRTFAGVSAAASGGEVAAGLASAVAPWLAIAGAVALVLAKLGLLDDALAAIGGFFTGLWSQVKPPLDRLFDSLEALWVAVNDGKGAFGPLIDILRIFLKVLIEVAGYILNVVGVAIGRVLGGIIDIIAGAINVIVGLLTGDWKRAWDGAVDILRGAGNILLGLLQLVLLRGLGGVLRGALSLIRGFASLAWSLIRGAFARIGNFIVERFGNAILALELLIRNVPKLLGKAIEGLVGFFRGVGSRIVSALRNGLEGVFKLLDRLPGHFGTQARIAVENFVNAFKNVGGKILTQLGQVGGAAKEFGKGIANGVFKLIEDGWNKSIGSKKIGPFNIPDIHLPRLQKGGPVPGGYGGGDKQIIAAEAGEFVVRKEAVSKWGMAFMQFLNGGPGGNGPGFQTGGRVQRSASGAASLLIEFEGGTLDDFSSEWRGFWNELSAVARRGGDRIYRDIRASLADVQNSFKVRGKDMADGWSDTWMDVQRVVFDGLTSIGRNTNNALDALGETRLRYNLSEPRRANRKATGGVIGQWGQRGMDRVLTWLGNGEAVLNHWHQAALNAMLPGQTTVRDVVEGISGYHAGGPEQPGFAAGRAPALPDVMGSKPGFAVFMAYFKKMFDDALYVISGYRAGSRVAGSGNISNHASGDAIDISNPVSIGGSASNPPPKSSLDRLYAFIGRYLPKPPRRDFLWRTTQGGNHFNHIHLGLDPIVTASLEAARRFISKWPQGEAFGDGDVVPDRRVTGPGGGIRRLAQSILNRVRKTANSFYEDKLGEAFGDLGGPGESDEFAGGVLDQGQVQRFIRNALRVVGITSNVGDWVRTLTRQAFNESRFDPNARNDTPAGRAAGGPKGILQVVDGTFAAYSLPGHKNVFNPLDNIIAAIRYIIAQYGGGDPDRGVAALWARGGGAYARGGVVDGDEGQPRNIIAHAGEWILNRFQQSRLAGLVGLAPSTLRSLLGFHGAGGAAGYQGGGEVTPRQNRINRIVELAEESLGVDAFKTVEDALNDLRLIIVRVGRLGKITKAVKPLTEVLDVATRDGGLLDQLRSGIERQFSRARLAIRSRRFQVVNAGRSLVAVRNTQTDVQAANEDLAQTRAERATLLDEERAIQAEFDEVQKRLQNRKLSAAQRNRLMQQRNNLQRRLDDAQDRVQQNVEDIYAAQQAAEQAAIEAAQKLIDEQSKIVEAINKRYSRALAGVDVLRRMATALGSEDQIEAANRAARDLMRGQVAELQARIAQARSVGANDLADQLEDQIRDLNVTIFESIQQELRDAMERINSRSQRSLNRLDLAGRMLDAVGAVGQTAVATLAGQQFSRGGIFQQRGDVLRGQRSDLNNLLARVLLESPGNEGLIRDLRDQIAELDVTIQENTRAAFNARLEDLNNQTGFSSNVIDLKNQILELQGSISGQTDVAAQIALQEERRRVLENQRRGLEQLMNEAIANADQQAMNDLTLALLENEVALLQNTQTINELNGTITAPQSFSSSAWTWFREAIFNGIGQVLPQYDPAMGMSSPALMNSGVYNVSPDTRNSDSVTRQDGDTIVNLYGYERPVDPTEISSAVGFARKTAQ